MIGGKRTIKTLKRNLPARAREVINLDDIKITLLLPLLFAIAWIVPDKYWFWISHNLFAGTQVNLSNDKIVRGVKSTGLGEELSASGIEIAGELHSHRYVSYLQYLRDYRPCGWRFSSDIAGEHQLRSAISAGAGTILWIAHFVFNGLPLKKALRQAGYEAFHLSRPEHGFSTTRYGIAFLNPIRSFIEERYLARRVIIKRGAEHVALREAHRLLSHGAIVSITAGHWEGRQIAQLPIGNAILPISTGAPSLAHATGAVLLPVFIMQDRDRRFRVTIGDSIHCRAKQSRNEAVTGALIEFSDQLLTHIRRSPGQWRGWKYLESATQPERVMQ